MKKHHILGFMGVAMLVVGLLVAGPQTSQAQSSTCYTFQTNLRFGSTGADVQHLTNFLVSQGFMTRTTTQFNETVASAVVGFQEAYASEILTPNGLSHGSGYVGPSTRAKLNALIGCSSSTTVTRSTTVAADSTASAVCPAGYICRPINPVVTPVTCPAGYVCSPVTSTSEPQYSTPPTYPSTTTYSDYSYTSQYPTTPVDPNISGRAALVGASEDKVFKWNGAAVHTVDWKWYMTIINSGSTNKYIKRMVLVHGFGEGWATDDNSNNPLSKNLRLLGTTQGNCSSCDIQNTHTDTLSYLVPAMGNLSLYAYGEPASQTFQGGSLLIDFTDGTSAKITVPASDITPSSNNLTQTYPTVTPRQPVVTPIVTPVVPVVPARLFGLSNTSGVLGSAVIRQNATVAYPVTFTFTLRAGQTPLYIIRAAPVALTTTSTGNAAASLAVIMADPESLSNDYPGAYVIPADTSRTFTFGGMIDNTNGTSGTKTFKVTQIRFGTSAANTTAESITQGLEGLSVTATF